MPIWRALYAGYLSLQIHAQNM